MSGGVSGVCEWGGSVGCVCEWGCVSWDVCGHMQWATGYILT